MPAKKVALLIHLSGLLRLIRKSAYFIAISTLITKY